MPQCQNKLVEERIAEELTPVELRLDEAAAAIIDGIAAEEGMQIRNSRLYNGSMCR